MNEVTHQFSDLPEAVQAGIRDLGWSEPTPVQAHVLPVFRQERDVIVQARTGSGKTGAFGLPMMCELDPGDDGVQALILVPTRELANQVAAELAILGKHTGLRCLAIYGGVAYGAQLEGLARGSQVVVGTPGRLLDHLRNARLRLDGIRFLVLDEADELLSLGFWPDMKKIDSFLPRPGQRHSSLFSATMPEKVRSLARTFLHEPEFVTLSEGQIGPSEIEHCYYLVTAQDKEHALVRILEYEAPESAIIFCNTKADVRYLTGFLKRHGYCVDPISGDLSQDARERAMGRIKAGTLRFLVATDVAARGIDISDLSHVISYTAPDAPDVYVHRTGRTGRAGKAGVAISLVSALDLGNFRFLQSANRIEMTERKLPNDDELTSRLAERLLARVGAELQDAPARRSGAERCLAVVDVLASKPEGRRALAALCALHLESPTRQPAAAAPEGEAAASPTPPQQATRGDEERPPSRSRSRSRRRRR